MKMRKRLTLLLVVGLLGCSQVNVRGDVDGGSAMDAPSAMRDVFVSPDVFAFTDVPALHDVTRLPDAVMDDAFIAPDSPLGVREDVLRRPDAPITEVGPLPDAALLDVSATPDASSADCGDLRLYFRFEETSGLVIDESGCGNHGTAIEVRRGEVGARGNAYGFGLPVTRATRVVVPDSASLRALPQMTVTLWVKDMAYSSAPFVSFVDGESWRGFAFRQSGDRAPLLELWSGRSCSYTGQFGSDTRVEMDRWTHLAATVDPSSGEVIQYMNGVEIYRALLDGLRPPLCDTGAPLWIGAVPRAGGIYAWNGSIDELRIWSVVRTQAEVCVDAGGVPNSLGGCAL